jgi:hypothetical protein
MTSRHGAARAGEFEAPAFSYAFHTAFAPPGAALRARAADLDLLGGRLLVSTRLGTP